MNQQTGLIAQMLDHAGTWQEEGDKRYIFLNCYALMTRNMLKAIDEGQFNDGEWVSRLLHLFADYYFVALQDYDCGEDCVPPVWSQAHIISCSKDLLAIQYLLLGINAHINYDLVLTLRDLLLPEWAGLNPEKRRERYLDHTHVNQVIADTIDTVQDEVIEKYSPWMNIIDRLMGRTDEWLVSRLIAHWREEVWKEAMIMVNAGESAEQERLRQKLEQRVLKRAQQIIIL